MEEKIRKILEQFEDIDPIITKRLLNDLGRNDAMDVILQEDGDSWGKIYIMKCPNCDESLKFDRYSQISQLYNYCYRCGQKLNKVKQEKQQEESEN